MPGDKDILIAATPEILNWWAQSTEGMDLWQLLNNGESIPISKNDITLATPLAEWAASVFV